MCNHDKGSLYLSLSSDSCESSPSKASGSSEPIRASARIAAQRLAEHAEEGGGTVVTGCASSSRRFKKSGAEVLDIVALVARSLATGDG